MSFHKLFNRRRRKGKMSNGTPPPQPSPRISECSTARNDGMETSSTSSPSVTTAHPPSRLERSSSTSHASTSSGFTASTNTSVFSVIGKTLSKFLHHFYGKPSAERNVSRRHIHKRFLRRRPINNRVSSKSSTSGWNSAEIQRWVFSCKGCTRAITEIDVRSDNAIYALGEIWHRSHLVCIKCHVAVGDEHRPFIAAGENEKEALCLDCHMESEHQLCTVCHKPLFETCIESEGNRMHHNCFVCEKCKAPFQDGQYALINGKPYDLDCYYFKTFETSLAPPMHGFFDMASPPTAATMTDSSISPASTATTIIENSVAFKGRPTEFVSLFDFATLPPPIKTPVLNSFSAEELELLKQASKSSPADGHLTHDKNGKQQGNKEKVDSKEMIGEAMPPSKKKLDTALSSSPVIDAAARVISFTSANDSHDSPIISPKEKLEDFANGHEEVGSKPKEVKSEKKDETTTTLKEATDDAKAPQINHHPAISEVKNETIEKPKDEPKQEVAAAKKDEKLTKDGTQEDDHHVMKVEEKKIGEIKEALVDHPQAPEIKAAPVISEVENNNIEKPKDESSKFPEKK